MGAGLRLPAGQPCQRALQTQGLGQPGRLLARQLQGLVAGTASIGQEGTLVAAVLMFEAGQMASGQGTADLDLVECQAKIFGVEHPQRLAAHRQRFINLAHLHQALAEHGLQIAPQVPGRNARGHLGAGPQQRRRRPDRAALQCRIAADQRAPTGELRIGCVFAGVDALIGQGVEQRDVASLVDHQRAHQDRAAGAVDVTRIAVGGGGADEMRVGLVPMAVVEVEKAQGMGCERDCGRVLRPRRQFRRPQVVAA